ncbi:hypothetical protein TruAng_000094 [Truncatella angustata]|nr:hypothetical protein TruAng_000094 [Truncatella angustata]
MAAETRNNAAHAQTGLNASTDTDESGQQKFHFDFSPSLTTNNNWHSHRQNHSSSKLPAFRFADLRKESLALPSLLNQGTGIPPSPVSPFDTDADASPNPNPNPSPSQDRGQDQDQDQDAARPRAALHLHALRETSQDSNTTRDNNNSPPRQQFQLRQQNSYHGPVSPELTPTIATTAHQHIASPDRKSVPALSRAATFQTPSKPAPASASATRPVDLTKRSVSLGATTALALNSQAADSPSQSASGSASTTVPTRPQQRRAPSYSETSSALRSRRRSSAGSQNGAPGDQVRSASASGQRELLLPKALQRTDSDGKRSSITRRPPVSYRPSLTSRPSSGGTAKIPPIRKFRSSGDRQSLGLDISLRSPSIYDDSQEDPGHRDSTLKALEGRRESDSYEATPPDSATEPMDADDSGDVFLKMAREEPEPQSAAARVIKSTHRRPLSSVIPSYQPMSPPDLSRRLSEQDSPRSKTVTDGQSAGGIARALTYRSPLSGNTSEVKGAGTKPSTLTPRTLTFQDASTDSTSAYGRRRQSITDNATAMPSRMSSIRTSGISSGRTFNSSPLVPKSVDFQKQDTPQGDHHTESSNSTAAPSTVWDELDDLKSRIHRLELTGKLPATSGAAISRATDERPPTANTNATTMSGSPKRSSGSAVAQADNVSTVSSSYGYKETQPLLQAAMTKSKPFLAPDVYSALESAASEVMLLSTMLGKAGEPGPVSSAVSNVGTPAVTDRQLRRKTEGICRSLTELCLALSENAAQVKQLEVTVPIPEKESIASPTIMRFSNAGAQRRPSALLDRSPASAAPSPRAMSRLEERRSSMLLNSALPSPSARYSSQIPSSPSDIPSRRTSLLIPRARRAGTEEPESMAGRQSSLLFRNRRAGTEEPEEISGRRTSILRTRRGTYDTEEEEPTARFRAPSRAITEFTAGRPPATRDFNPQIPIPSIETTSLGNSALPRRRLGSSTVTTRLIQPSTNSSLATRRYLERTTPDREANNIAEKLAEERGQRSFSFAHSNIHSRTSSISRRRESMLNNSVTAQPGGYR